MDTNEAPNHAEGALDREQLQRVLDQVDVWRKQLINLARSNRLLYFRHTRTSTLEIKETPERYAAVLPRLFAGGYWYLLVPRRKMSLTTSRVQLVTTLDRPMTNSSLRRRPRKTSVTH